MLDRFDQMVTGEMRQRAAEMNISLHEVVTLASIVEREAPLVAERPIIADIYLSRYQMRWHLDADPTIQYVLGDRRAWWPVLSGDDLFVESPYNTYQHDGLPPGPIANPSLESIEAVLYPAETDYLFFVAKGDTGEHAFAATFEEHQANIDQWLNASAAETVTPPACVVAPRTEPVLAGPGTPSRSTRLPGTPSAVAVDIPAGATPDPIAGAFKVAEDQLPVGEPADPLVIAGIRDTIIDFAVCQASRESRV